MVQVVILAATAAGMVEVATNVDLNR